MEIKDFTCLLLATLANNSTFVNLKDKNTKMISLPSNYKQVIQNIMNEKNGWREEFSVLIDTDEYFDDHFKWEKEFALSLKSLLSKLNKKVIYDLEKDRLIIELKKDEVQKMLARYDDEEIKAVMDHFASLLVDFTYTREFKENYYGVKVNNAKKGKK